jgi:hypothetical protein
LTDVILISSDRRRTPVPLDPKVVTVMIREFQESEGTEMARPRSELEFPVDWPDGCPPDDAVDAGGVFFRIVKSCPPVAADFVSHFESGRMPKAPVCLRCGLSVFEELRDAIHQQRLLPNLGRLIAQGTLSADHGKTKLTTGKQPTHTTWWPYRGVDRSSLFTIAAEEG